MGKRIDALKKKDYNHWIKIRQEVEETISNSQSLFCLCGSLATGFHESTCRKFRSKVDSETYKKITGNEK